MSKRILSLVLTLALVLGSFSMAFADTATTTKSMTDVEGTKYEKAVVTLGKLKVLEGYTDGTFKPENTITRAEFAAVASRIRGLETAAQNSKGTTEFKDVPASHWASGYVNVASKNGIIKGMGNGTFAPESQITYEQAITMIVRALGYEYAAQSLGGYPVGYLSVASQEQLLKGINEGAQGQPASRGLVALLLNNALDIPKMIQVGYGDQAKWIKSGSEFGTSEVFLFEDLGLKQITKAEVTKVDSKKQTVQLTPKDSKNSFTLKADKDFNYEGFDGLRVTAWYDGKTDELIVCKDDGAYKVKFDALAVTKNAKEIKLVTEDSKYDLADKDDLQLNGKLEDKAITDLTTSVKHNFVKVVLDERNDVKRIDAYDLKDVVVVEDVDGKNIEGYNSVIVDDADKYTIIKDGKQVNHKDLSTGDVLIYDAKAEYAVVLTKTVEGKIERVYEDGFKLDSKVYDLANDYSNAKAEYLVGKDLLSVDDKVLEEMRDNGEVKVYLSFDKEVIFIEGEAEKVTSNYALVTDTSEKFSERTKDYVSVDVLTSEGKTVEYKLEHKLVDKDNNPIDAIEIEKNKDVDFDTFKGIVEAGKVIEIKVDSSNKLTSVKEVSDSAALTKVKLDSNYIGGFENNKSATVFWKNGESKFKDYKVLTLAEAQKEFDEFDGFAYGDSKDKLVSIVANDTNKDTAGEDTLGIVREVKKLAGKDNYDVKFEVNGEEKTYTAKDKDFADLSQDDVVILKISKDGELKGISTTKIVTEYVSDVSKASSREIEGYQLRGKYYVEGNKELEEKSATDARGEGALIYFMDGVNQAQLVIINPAASRLSEILEADSTNAKIAYKNENYEVSVKDNTKDVEVKSALTGKFVLITDVTGDVIVDVPNADFEIKAGVTVTGDVIVNGIKVNTLYNSGTISGNVVINVVETKIEGNTVSVVINKEGAKLVVPTGSTVELGEGVTNVNVTDKNGDKVTPKDEEVLATGVSASGEVTTQGAEAVVGKAAVAATVTIDGVKYEAATAGVAGNEYKVTIEQGIASSGTEEVVTAGTIDAAGNLVITLGADWSVDTSTPKSVTADDIAGLTFTGDGAALITASAVADAGTTVQKATTETSLADGAAIVEGKDAVAEEYTLTVTATEAKAGTIIVKVGDAAGVEVAVTEGMTADAVATAIKNALTTVEGYTISTDTNKVVFTASVAGEATDLSVTVADKK